MPPSGVVDRVKPSPFQTLGIIELGILRCTALQQGQIWPKAESNPRFRRTLLHQPRNHGAAMNV
jgi:hypothetical protein